nr:hypothetical protein [Ochrobactrum sp. UNC390CL2Tsu3S39]
MSRFKTVRNPALTEAEKQQILSRLIALKELMNGCTANLEIGCEDYKLLDHLGREVMTAGETIAKSRFWGKPEMHKIGGK